MLFIPTLLYFGAVQTCIELQLRSCSVQYPVVSMSHLWSLAILMHSHATRRNLLAHGADVLAKDPRGRTALHEACRARDPFAVKVITQ